MIFKQISSGGDRNFCYLVGCEEEKMAALIDPSPDPEPCYKEVRDLGMELAYVINTHNHFDHTGGNEFFIKNTGAKLVTHTSCMVGEVKVEDGDTLELGNLELTFIHTPGHTDESMCVLVEKELATGDTLFVGKVGGTYSRSAAEVEFESLQKLLELDDDIRVWPGHNYGVKPSSTIGEERSGNPFLQRLGKFDDFFWLKENWAQYKKEHGIQ